MKPTVTPFLWFDDQAEHAALFYQHVFGADVEIIHVSRYPANSRGEAGAAMTVVLTVLGQKLIFLNGGPMYQLDEAFSLQVNVDTQEEIERYASALVADGGEDGHCGWLKDKFGVSWQVTPRCLSSLLSTPDPEQSGRVMQAFMGMKRIDIAALQAAAL